MKSYLFHILITTILMSNSLVGKSVLFVNCRIDQHSQADAILCQDGKIKAIGKASDFNSEVIVDLKGGFVYPGFIDAHLHLVGLGKSLEILDLVGTGSVADIVDILSREVERLKQENIEPGTHWIQGRGWDQNDWVDTGFPTKDVLDQVTSDYPVYLRRIDGHMAWVNSTVLDIAGITSDTPDPDGGRIKHDIYGNPTGILVDNGIDLLLPYLPVDMPADRRRQILKAAALLNSLGITSVHDAGTEFETIRVLKDLITEDLLSLRVYAMLENKPDHYLPFLSSGVEIENSFLQIRALKLYLDGALGSRGAALLMPYADDPENYGLNLTDISVVEQLVQQFNMAGFQIGIHCIGDRANRIALNIFEKIQRRLPGDYRNRIEHAQIIHPDDISRFSKLGVLPSMQATHCTSDMYWADERLGAERLAEAYPWNSLVRHGSIIPGGSDAPVEYPDPLAGIYAAITRIDKQGWPEGGWQPAERLTIDHALKMYTEWAAFASFEENVKGKLAPGYYADFTVLSDDLRETKAEGILNTRILFTIVNGNIVFSNNSLRSGRPALK